MQQQYSDLPAGAQVVNQPQVAQSYSDLPQGSQLVHDPNDAGAFTRFAARAIGVPEDVFKHPNKWLNPFSKEYSSPEHKREAAGLAPDPIKQPPTGAELIPGHQTYQDVKSGNYAGAAGDVLNTAGQVSSLMGFRKPAGAPVEVPSVYEGTIPAEIPAGRPQSGGLINKAANAVANINTPPGTSLIAPKITAAQKLASMIARVTEPSPAQELPVYGNASNAEARGPYQPYQGDLTVKPQMAPEAAGQVPTPQEAAPALAQPSGVLSRLPSESPLSGESALRQVLTGQDNANLMRIAKARGINVTKESVLKPGIADKFLVNKIIDDFGPDELDEVGARYMDSQRFKHNFGDVGPEAWKSMSMQTYFPDVKLPDAMVKRVNAAIQSTNPQPQTAVPPKAVAQAAAAGAPIPQGVTSQMSDVLRQSLAQRGIIVDANGKIIKGR